VRTRISRLGDFIEDRKIVSPAEAVISRNLKEQTETLLKTLTAAREKVIKMRFRLVDGNEHTLEEVGHIRGHARASGRIEPRRCASCAPRRSRKLKAFLAQPHLVARLALGQAAAPLARAPAHGWVESPDWAMAEIHMSPPTGSRRTLPLTGRTSEYRALA